MKKFFFLIMLFILPLSLGIWIEFYGPKLGYICTYALEQGHLDAGTEVFSDCVDKLRRVNFYYLIKSSCFFISFLCVIFKLKHFFYRYPNPST